MLLYRHENSTGTDLRARKGIPVLFSPTPSRHFSKEGVWEGPGARHPAYFDRLPGLAQSEKVDFVEMMEIRL